MELSREGPYVSTQLPAVPSVLFRQSYNQLTEDNLVELRLHSGFDSTYNVSFYDAFSIFYLQFLSIFQKLHSF